MNTPTNKPRNLFKWKNTPIEIHEITIEKRYDETKKLLFVSYRYQGQLCPLKPLRGKKIQNFGDLELIAKDLKLAKSSFSLARSTLLKIANAASENRSHLKFDESNENDLILWSLCISGISTYGKCFNQASGRNAKYPEQKLKDILNQSELNHHKRLIELRNNWVAHGGKNNKEAARPTAILDPNQSILRLPQVAHHVSHATSLSLEQLELSTNIINIELDYLKQIQEKNYWDIYDNMILPSDPDSWYEDVEYEIAYHEGLN